MSKLNQAYERAREAVTLLYHERATIYANQNEGPVRGFSDGKKDRQAIAEDVPVKVSKRQLDPIDGVSYSTGQYAAIILMDNSIKVPAGAIFEVTDMHGVKRVYRQASEGYTAYPTHQEVAVEYSQQV
ncbi:hypothetical protein [Fructobacillus tropaeoli]|uniref:Uncharacterized protein n=1 Tax=Fructobacillus tropaeoli TaxID=709323 RepID=A0A3F3HBL9_9LACO|nr:hypothetical protein [Fructobacillus tropaeoli]GAP04888.1 hypothetical protein FTRO_0110230 [Fructobacillus tropaeoli]